MGKISARLQARSRSRQVQTAGGVFDLWLVRTAHLSQALLLLLGVFGYFYTVRPVYEKALLDEEIAQKTLQIRDQETRLAQLKKEASENAEIAALARKDAESAKVAVGKAKQEARRNYTRLRSEYIAIAMNELRNCSTPFLRGEPDGAELKRCPAEVKQRVGYLFEVLDAADVKLLESLVRSQVAAAQPKYAALVEDFKQKIQKSTAEAEDLKRRMDQRKAQPHDPKMPPPPGYFTGAVDLFLDYAKAREQVSRVRSDASEKFWQILDEVANRVSDKFYEQALP